MNNQIIYQIRRKNIFVFIEENYNGDKNEFIETIRLNIADSKCLIDALNNNQVLGDRIIRNLENKLNLPFKYFDKVTGLDDEIQVPPNKFKIYHYDVRASAGNGMEVISSENIIGHEVFDEEFIFKYNVKKENLAIITVAGHSMKPTLRNGERVIIDISKKHEIDNKVFALTSKNKLWVKRLKMTSDGYRWQSDNKEYCEFDKNLNDGKTTIRIIGLVIYKLGQPVN